MNETPELTTLTALLQKRFFQHNVRALTLSALSLAGAAVLWTIAYVIAAWLTLLFVTIITGTEGRDAAMPARFNGIYLGAGGVLLTAAWLRRAWTPNARPRNTKSAFVHLADFLLTAPAITLAIWGNLSAWQWFSAWESEQAARLLAAILEEKRLPLSSTPVVIPDDRMREKAILGLLLIGVAELWREDDRAYLRLARAAERSFLEPGTAALRTGGP